MGLPSAEQLWIDHNDSIYLGLNLLNICISFRLFNKGATCCKQSICCFVQCHIHSMYTKKFCNLTDILVPQYIERCYENLDAIVIKQQWDPKCQSFASTCRCKSKDIFSK